MNAMAVDVAKAELGGQDLKDWDKALRLEEEAKKAYRRKDPAEARRLYDKAADLKERVSERIVLRADGMYVAGALAEARRLERPRGVTLEVSRELKSRGQVQLKGKDGLANLFDAGSLTGLSEADRKRPELRLDGWTKANVRLFAGYRYRGMYELIAADALRPAVVGEAGTPSATNSAPEKGFKVAMAGKGRRAIEDEVFVCAGGRARRVLQLIAGDRRTNQSLTASGAARDRNVKALIKALDIVALSLRMPGSAILKGRHVDTFRKRERERLDRGGE